MNILIASSIDPDAISRLRQRHDVICAPGASPSELQQLVRDREVLVFRSGVTISAKVMSQAPRLALLVRGGCGCDNIDLDYVRQRGLRLVRVPQPAAKAVAELAFSQMLVLSRQVLKADQSMRQGKWLKRELNGTLLTGKVLGVIGAGNIGTRVGQLGAAWHMDVIGCVEHPNQSAARRLSAEGIQLASFCDVLQRADFITIHVPLKESTRHLIDRRALNRTQPGVYLVNTSRGGVVDEQALREALESGHVRGAALDVHQREGEGCLSPLADLPNVLLTPHIGSNTVDTQREIGERIIEIIEEHAAAPTAGGVPLGT